MASDAYFSSWQANFILVTLLSGSPGKMQTNRQRAGKVRLSLEAGPTTMPKFGIFHAGQHPRSLPDASPRPIRAKAILWQQEANLPGGHLRRIQASEPRVLLGWPLERHINWLNIAVTPDFNEDAAYHPRHPGVHQL